MSDLATKRRIVLLEEGASFDGPATVLGETDPVNIQDSLIALAFMYSSSRILAVEWSHPSKGWMRWLWRRGEK